MQANNDVDFSSYPKSLLVLDGYKQGSEASRRGACIKVLTFSAQVSACIKS